MNPATLKALGDFPVQLEAFYAAIPPEHANWTPQSWDGIPSESFSALGQICHVRDIEIDGYQVRFRRALTEHNPTLATLDGYALEITRDYAHADPAAVLSAFRAARAETLRMLAALDESALERPAVFEDYGSLTVRSLVHFLASHDQQHLAGLQWLLGKLAAAPAVARSSGPTRS